MQRHEMIDAMRGLGLKGMAGAFDDAVTTGIQRKRTAMEILSDLLRAEGAHRHAASIRYRMTAARLPVVKDLDAFVFENTPINEGLVRSLHAGSFLPGRRNVVLVGGSLLTPSRRSTDCPSRLTKGHGTSRTTPPICTPLPPRALRRCVRSFHVGSIGSNRHQTPISLE